MLLSEYTMDPTILEFIVRGGVPILSLVLLFLLAKHHIKTLREHRSDEKACVEKLGALEEAYRAKVEELLKEQIRWVEKISDTLAESGRALEALRDELNRR